MTLAELIKQLQSKPHAEQHAEVEGCIWNKQSLRIHAINAQGELADNLINVLAKHVKQRKKTK